MLTGTRADDVATDAVAGYEWCNDKDAVDVVAVSWRIFLLHVVPIRRCQSKVPPYLYDRCLALDVCSR